MIIGHYELVDVRTFLVVSDCGSISKAAQILGITKSMASHRVARLEHALGSELLHRSNRGVQLTSRGALYRAQACEGLALMESAAESVVTDSLGATGSLRVSVPMTFATHVLAPILLDFMSYHSGLELDVELHDHRVDLAAEGYDLGVRITNHTPEGFEQTIPLALSRRVICCSPSYAEKYGVPTTVEQLSEHSAIGYSNQKTSRLWSFLEQSVSEGSIPKQGRIVTNNGEMMRDAAIAGLGITILPLFIVASDLRAGRLRTPLLNPNRIRSLPSAQHEEANSHEYGFWWSICSRLSVAPQPGKSVYRAEKAC